MPNPIPLDPPNATGLPEWATTPTEAIIPPSLGAAQAGYVYSDKPPSTWVNWFQNLVYKWIKYIKYDIDTGRDVTYGYRHDGSRLVRFNLGSPCVPGDSAFFVSGTALALNGTSSAPGVPVGTFHTRPGDLNSVIVFCQVPRIEEGPDDQTFGAGTHWVLTELGWHGVRAAAATTVKVQVWRQRRDNASAPTADAQQGVDFDVASTAGALARETKAVSINIDPAYRYYLKVTLDAAVSAAEIEWHNLECRFQKKRVE